MSAKRRSLSLNENKQKEIFIGDYIVKHTIGKGTFSRVKLGVNKYSGEKVAIKILDKTKIVEKEDLERIIREMEMLAELDNDHVIKVYQIYEDDNNYLIIMEYCEGGELFDYIVEKERLDEVESSIFFYPYLIINFPVLNLYGQFLWNEYTLFLQLFDNKKKQFHFHLIFDFLRYN